MAFSLLIMPAIASAYIGDPGQNVTFGTIDNSYTNYSNSGQYYNQSVYQPPVYVSPPAPAPTPVVYSNETNPNTANAASAPKTVVKANTPKTYNVSALAANALYGANSFLPSGLIQWILFAIFILLIVILVRITFGYKENYHATPLKQE